MGGGGAWEPYGPIATMNRSSSPHITVFAAVFVSIILGFTFLRSQGNSSFGVLVNIKLARSPITENSLNFGGRLMWKF